MHTPPAQEKETAGSLFWHNMWRVGAAIMVFACVLAMLSLALSAIAQPSDLPDIDRQTAGGAIVGGETPDDATCPAGTWLHAVGVCVQCGHACAVCDDETGTCSTCTRGYTTMHTEAATPDPCVMCAPGTRGTANGTCAACADGTWAARGATTCSACAAPCEGACDVTSGDCTECPYGTHMDNYACVPCEAPLTFGGGGDARSCTSCTSLCATCRHCVACDPYTGACTACDPGHAGIACEPCDDGMSYASGTDDACVPCSESCLACDPVTGACLACATDTDKTLLLYKGVCVPPDIVDYLSDGCRTHHPVNESLCVDCYPAFRYVAETHTCELCDEGETSRGGTSDTCYTECIDFQYLDASGQCVGCPDGCLYCDGLSGECGACRTGYRLDPQTLECLPGYTCVEGCNHCLVETGVCVSCISGLSLWLGGSDYAPLWMAIEELVPVAGLFQMCTPCAPGCAECLPLLAVCLSCVGNATFNPDDVTSCLFSCDDECGVNMPCDPFTGECLTCVAAPGTHCEPCTAGCILCEPVPDTAPNGTVPVCLMCTYGPPVDGRCDQCEPGTYASGGTCIPCSELCVSCEGDEYPCDPVTGSCLNCPSGYQLTQNGTCESCPASTWRRIDGDTPLGCSDPCQDCTVDGEVGGDPCAVCNPVSGFCYRAGDAGHMEQCGATEFECATSECASGRCADTSEWINPLTPELPTCACINYYYILFDARHSNGDSMLFSTYAMGDYVAEQHCAYAYAQAHSIPFSGDSVVSVYPFIAHGMHAPSYATVDDFYDRLLADDEVPPEIGGENENPNLVFNGHPSQGGELIGTVDSIMRTSTFFIADPFGDRSDPALADCMLTGFPRDDADPPVPGDVCMSEIPWMSRNASHTATYGLASRAGVGADAGWHSAAADRACSEEVQECSLYCVARVPVDNLNNPFLLSGLPS